MIQTINESQFVDSFTGDYKDNFSYYGKKALFEYLEQYEEDCDDTIELDPIGLCCEYSEYENAIEALVELTGNDYLENQLSETEQEQKALEYLQENTQVIEFKNDNPFMKERTSGIIIHEF